MEPGLAVCPQISPLFSPLFSTDLSEDPGDIARRLWWIVGPASLYLPPQLARLEPRLPGIDLVSPGIPLRRDHPDQSIAHIGDDEAARTESRQPGGLVEPRPIEPPLYQPRSPGETGDRLDPWALSPQVEATNRCAGVVGHPDAPVPIRDQPNRLGK